MFNFGKGVSDIIGISVENVKKLGGEVKGKVEDVKGGVEDKIKVKVIEFKDVVKVKVDEMKNSVGFVKIGVKVLDSLEFDIIKKIDSDVLRMDDFLSIFDDFGEDIVCCLYIDEVKNF